MSGTPAASGQLPPSGLLGGGGGFGPRRFSRRRGSKASLRPSNSSKSIARNGASVDPNGSDPASHHPTSMASLPRAAAAATTSPGVSSTPGGAAGTVMVDSCGVPLAPVLAPASAGVHAPPPPPAAPLAPNPPPRTTSGGSGGFFPRRGSQRGSMRASRKMRAANGSGGTPGRPARAFFGREHGAFAAAAAAASAVVNAGSHQGHHQNGTAGGGDFATLPSPGMGGAMDSGVPVRVSTPHQQWQHPHQAPAPASRVGSGHSVPNPLALLSKLDVLACGYMFVTQHGGTVMDRMFRRNVIRRYAEARGRVVLLRDEQNGGVHEVFSPVGCAVSVADTVMTKRGAVEHNVNIAKGGFTLQLRFSSETQAEQWADVLARMAATRMPKLSDFEVMAPIGEGASGKVFLVRDRRTRRKLALKCMSKSASALAQNSSDSRHAVDERITHEVMNGSHYIVGLRHAFQTRSKLYLATEFCDGGDVYNFVDSHGGGVSEDQARIITAQVVLGLKKLHDRDIVFRDLKPENVLITGDGRVRLADFGLCKQLDASAAMTRTVCGTFSYAAAEILSGGGYGRSCDLWALGVFLYHIMIGRPPRVSASVQEAKANIFESKEPIIWYSDVMSEQAMSLVTSLIEVDPTRRLGCGPAGIVEVFDHPFFKGVDWTALAAGQVPVDIKESLPAPELGDLRNFNQEEWANIQMDPDRDNADYMESSLWPLRNVVTNPLPVDFVVSYSYSAESMTKIRPSAIPQ